jgi:hypothetical protein
MRSWPWKLIGCVAVVVIVLGALYFFGQSQYARGVSDERAAWAERLHQAELRAADAEKSLAADVSERQRQADARAARQQDHVAQTREEIAHAPDAESRLAAYRALRERLRNDAAAHLDRADADYLSSLAA